MLSLVKTKVCRWMKERNFWIDCQNVKWFDENKLLLLQAIVRMMIKFLVILNCPSPKIKE